MKDRRLSVKRNTRKISVKPAIQVNSATNSIHKHEVQHVIDSGAKFKMLCNLYNIVYSSEVPPTCTSNGSALINMPSGENTPAQHDERPPTIASNSGALPDTQSGKGTPIERDEMSSVARLLAGVNVSLLEYLTETGAQADKQEVEPGSAPIESLAVEPVSHIPHGPCMPQQPTSPGPTVADVVRRRTIINEPAYESLTGDYCSVSRINGLRARQQQQWSAYSEPASPAELVDAKEEAQLEAERFNGGWNHRPPLLSYFSDSLVKTTLELDEILSDIDTNMRGYSEVHRAQMSENSRVAALFATLQRQDMANSPPS
ncbi:hypothetical protein GGI17_000934 [Coemansia sp. S146]|nr:hypothetical protein GGI17_000934 [Coemansia sp. S146]